VSAPVLLVVEALNAWLDAAQILFDISLSVGRGEAVALMGRNGAGKSTTMKAIMGLINRRGGSVCFHGHDISKWPSYRVARLGLGFTPQERRIFTSLTVLENLDIGRQPPRQFADGTPAPEFTPERLFAIFPNLGERRNALGRDMSGGEQQMLSIARTLMGNPLLVLLDEPSEGVAPIVVEQLATTILQLKSQGVSVLLSEQNVVFAALVCDRAYVLEKGVLRWQGVMAEFRNNTALQRTFVTM
jgi:branched-chain amino acid transport system ATP-binding protein